MKRCPQCNRTYTDDALSFCLDDGSPLVSASAPSSFDPSATIQYPQSRETTPQPTIAYGPGQPPPSTPPPQWSPMPPIAPQKRSVWPWILGIGAVLAFMGVGVVVLIIVLASMADNNNNNANANSNANSNRANRNSNAANTNANTRSTLASHTDDFSEETWYTGSSTYGRTWYEDDEYHIKASTNGYIVMYAPADKPEFYSENATVRATVRSVEGESPDSGYGLLVHGVRENNQFRDYGFLIYSGDSPKYAIVQHKNSTETKLVSWTATSTIRTGTTPNQLEVRIRDRRLDFYINGQFVTSITDSEDFLRGRVGFYSSDTNEVAFDDLEISK